jgi:hypothetical protein
MPKQYNKTMDQSQVPQVSRYYLDRPVQTEQPDYKEKIGLYSSQVCLQSGSWQDYQVDTI